MDTADHADAVPLLSIHNVRPYATVWPIAKGSEPLALTSDQQGGGGCSFTRAKNYVLLRQFNALRRTPRRLTASPYIQSATAREGSIAVTENHLNYVTHMARELTEAEVHGLVALFNSALLDRYFRVLSGNTQVNATEIRSIPFPDLRTIARIGECVGSLDGNHRARRSRQRCWTCSAYRRRC